jgi:CheY-like chemotaxis protein
MLGNSQAGAAILIMGRDDADRKLIDSVLERVGLIASSADSANEALQLARQQSTRLVIVDLATPDLNFSTFLEELKQIDKNIGVVCLADERGTLTLPHTATPIQRCLPRPFRKARLLGAIMEAAEAPISRTA